MKFVRILLWSAVIFGVLIVALFFFDNSALNGYALQLLTDRLSNNAVRVSADTFALSGIGFALTAVRILIVQLLLTIQIDLFSLNCMSLALFTGSPECAISGNMYGGDFEAIVESDGKSTIVRSASLRNLALGTHTQIQALGFKGGMLSGQASELVSDGQAITSGTATATVKNLALVRPLQLSPRITGLPFPVIIPAFTIESLKVDTNVSEKKAQIDASTTLGTVIGTAPLDRRGPFDLVLNLSSRGAQELKAPLSLICPPGTLERNEKIRLKGSNQRVSCSPAF